MLKTPFAGFKRTWRKAFRIVSDNNFRAAAACAVFFYYNLSVDSVLQFRHVRNDAHQPVAFAEAGQCAHGLIQGFLIQRAKAFVHKHGIQAHAAGGGLNFVRKPQCQRQRGEEGFAAGQGFYAARRTVVVIDNLHIQAALAAVVFAAEPAAQFVLSAGHAHKTHIVHRDIKPHNILITHDNVLKVTDFGIARAVSSETLVAGSSALGSVHYISPEQARGGYVDERSDIYSMGIVIYEMLTGKVPFDGENPVTVAIMHLEKDAENIRNINPDVPENVASIVMKAVSREQHARYQTAAEMGNDLRRVLDEVYDQGRVTKEDVAMLLGDISVEGGDDDVAGKKGKKGRTKRVKTEQEKREDRLAVIFALITVVIVLAIAGGTYLFVSGGVSREVTVPDLVDMTLEEAKKVVEGTEFTIAEEYKEAESDEVEEGHIISQEPAANQSVKKNTEISLVISIGDGEAGEDEVIVPEVVELDYEAAEKALKEKGLKVKKEEESSDTISEGAVVRQDPEKGDKVKKESVVTLYVSTGSKEKYSVPDLAGSTRTKAESMLKSAGLQIGNVKFEHSDKPDGTVISQSPESGSEVSKNSFVNIVLSNGPENSATPAPEVSGNSGNTNTAPVKTPTPTVAPIKKQKTLTVLFPDDVGDTVNVKVVANGNVIHNQTHNKSEGGVRIPVVGSKDAEVEIYLDGKLTDRKTIEFD